MEALEEQLKSLQEQLNQKEQDLMLAAEIGKQLLENNNELTSQLEETRKEFTGKVQTLEQEKYGLQRRLDQKVHMEKNYMEEIDGLQQTLKKKKEEYECMHEVEHKNQILEFKKQVGRLQAEVDQAGLLDRQQRDKIQQLEEMVRDTQEQLEQKVSLLNETCSEELAQLHTELNSLQADKMSLTRELSDLNAELQQTQLQQVALQSKLKGQEEELEEKQCQITSYYNALEKSRMETQDLKVELDMMSLESQDLKKKGNSLFAEVEDRRVQAEKELISMRVQHESLKTQHAMTQQHLHKLKMQIAGLLQMSRSHADVDHIERLQTQLVQARNEVQSLTGMLHQNKRRELQTSEGDYMRDFKQLYGDNLDANYVEYLQALLKSKDEQISKVQEELQTKRLLLLAESDKVMEGERALYRSERMLESLQSQNIKFHLQLEELQLKYEPEKVKSSHKAMRRIKEKIPMSKGSSENCTMEDPSELEKSSKIKVNSEVQPTLEIDIVDENNSRIESPTPNVAKVEPPLKKVMKPVVAKAAPSKRPAAKTGSSQPAVAPSEESQQKHRRRVVQVLKMTDDQNGCKTQ